jgi:hypothetical protein
LMVVSELESENRMDAVSEIVTTRRILQGPEIRRYYAPYAWKLPPGRRVVYPGQACRQRLAAAQESALAVSEELRR